MEGVGLEGRRIVEKEEKEGLDECGSVGPARGNA